MNKCIVVSDSFKGTLKSSDICSIARDTIPRFFPETELITIPMADGGEGTVDCLVAALGAEPVAVSVSGPYSEETEAVYATYGGSAIIEMASCAGLPLVGDRKDPSLTTTYGVGEIIAHAVENGAKHIFLGLGGSCTTDGGCGCAAALGARFFDVDGKSFIPTGSSLKDVAGIDISAVKRRLNGVSITVMCDVDNPMFGPNGAAYVFGPQKGADEEMCRMLDDGLVSLNTAIRESIGMDMANITGAGAGGAMGAGTIAFLGGTICSGIDAILALTRFESRLDGCDLVISGEGRLDDQSFDGKVISGVAERTSKRGIPLYLIVGTAEGLSLDVSKKGISAVFETNREHLPFEEVAPYAAPMYRAALEDALRYRKIFERKQP